MLSTAGSQAGPSPGPVAAREPSMSIPKRLVLAVMLGVMLARLAGMVLGVSGMAVRRMGVMRGGLVRIRFVMLGGLTMMLGGMLVMFGCGAMMLDDLVFGHDALRAVNGEAVASSPADSRKVMLHRCEALAAVDMKISPV